METKIEDANKLFEKISKELTDKDKGKIVAIDTDSGSYFIGDSELDAYRKAIKNIRIRNLCLRELALVPRILLVLFHN